MRKLFIVLTYLLISTGALTQNKIEHLQRSTNFPNVLKVKNNQLFRTQLCGVDTVYYTDAKSTNQAIKVAFTTGSSATGYVVAYAQKFVGSSNVTVNGFKWFGRSNDPLLASNPIINVVCEMYDVGANGLPIGAALASGIVIVDTSSNNIEHNVVFASPVTTSNDYILVVKNNQADQLFIYSNDETNNDGQDEYLSGVYYEPLGSWRKSEDVFGFGNFDMLYYPFVQYSVTAAFSPPALSCQNGISTFTNTSSNHFTNRMLNVDKYNGAAIQHDWVYGDGNTSNNQTTGSNIFSNAGVYNQTLTSTINGWTMTCTDIAVSVLTVDPQPSAPISSSPSAVCEFDTLADLIVSGGGVGAIYTWYSNAGLSTQVGMGTPYTSNVHQVDTLYVTVTENGCESLGTVVPLDFDSNAVPVYSFTNQGAGVFDFNSPLAASYAWDFDDGDTDNIQSPSHTFTSSGPFNVCLDVVYGNGCTNQYCESMVMTGEEEFESESKIFVYPIPSEGIFSISTELNKSLLANIYSIEGKVVFNTPFYGNITIDITYFPSGTYFLEIMDQETLISRKKLLKY